MKTTNNFREFMSYIDWHDLDINEKRALVDAAKSSSDLDLGVFKTQLLEKLEDKTILEYNGEIGLILDLNTRRDFIHFLEYSYMHGEDAESYLSFLEENGGSEIVAPFRTKTMHLLPNDKIVFLKRINLENRYMSGEVYYARKKASNYTITPKEKTIQEELLYGYIEDEYPSDELDKAILNNIRLKFPNAACHTSLLMFDVEVENLKHILKQMQKDVMGIHLEFIPTNPALTPTAFVSPIDAFCYPNPDNLGHKLNQAVVIMKEDWAEYSHLLDLLKNTYFTMSDILK